MLSVAGITLRARVLDEQKEEEKMSRTPHLSLCDTHGSHLAVLPSHLPHSDELYPPDRKPQQTQFSPIALGQGIL